MDNDSSTKDVREGLASGCSGALPSKRNAPPPLCVPPEAPAEPLAGLRLRVVPRTLRFLQPAGTSRGVYTVRRVWYVVMRYVEGRREALGVGECAPLPDLSCDYDATYEARLRRVCAQAEAAGRIPWEALREIPSMLMGLETAARSARGSLGGDPFQLCDTPFSRGEAGIRINGLVWMGRQDEMLQRMEAKLAAGYGCVKLKIGAIDFEAELGLVQRLRARFGPASVELRVDANGAFSPHDAPHRLEALAPYAIHSIEQPLRAGQWAALAALCRNTPIPIALDEELIGLNDVAQKRLLLETVRPQYLVLKPSLHGGFHGAAEWASEATRRHIPFWVTSALETNVGLNAIAQWQSQLQAAPPLCQGLGTGQLFVRNCEGPALRIEGDRLWRGAVEDGAFRREVRRYAAAYRDDCPTLTLHTSGSTGRPRPLVVQKWQLAASARRTCRFFGLEAGDTALLSLPLRYVAGQMVVVRAEEGGLRLISVAPTTHPYARLHRAPHFACLTPLQAAASLEVPRERRLLRATKCLLLGGGSVPPELEGALRDFPGAVWSGYAMTETFSHVALRRLNGPSASEWYVPMAGVAVSLSTGGTLQVTDDVTGVSGLVTHDVGELRPDGSFRVLGRRDNVVCSGGLKFQIEELEARLRPFPVPYVLTSVPDARLGEALVLLFEGAVPVSQLRALCRDRLPRHAVPRHYFSVASLPTTETGKPARAEAKALAAEFCGQA